MKEDAKSASKTQVNVLDRSTYKQKIRERKVGQAGKRTATTWCDERKRTHS